MWNHFNIWQGIHVIPDFITYNLTYMLHIIQSFYRTIIFYAKEKGTTQAVGKQITLVLVAGVCCFLLGIPILAYLTR